MKTKTAMQELIDVLQKKAKASSNPEYAMGLEHAAYCVMDYASQPMSEPTVEQLREAAKNHPDTFLAGALYVIDNYKLNSPLMSSEQYSSGAIHSLGEFPATKSMSAEQVLFTFIQAIKDEFKDGNWDYLDFIAKRVLSASPTVKAGGWERVEDKLPEVLETVWVSNGKGWTTLGCRTDYYENDEGGFDWCWAGSNGIIYEESGKIVSECEGDDLDVRFWHPLPEPPVTK